MDLGYEIVDAKITDIPQIRNIFQHYVENTTSCLEENTPTEEEMEESFNNIKSNNLPFLVSKTKNEGKIIGYCYISPYRKRSAYRFTVENSVYLHPDYLGKGIAKNLMEEAINICNKNSYKMMVAVIVSSSKQSIDFHKKMGFKQVGKLEKVGFKHNIWLNTIFMQKPL